MRRRGSLSIISPLHQDFQLLDWKIFLFVLTLPDLLGSGGVAASDLGLARGGSGLWMMDWIGVILRKNLLFLSEMSPDPSILTLYWRWGSTSTMRPVRSHLLGLLPAWFWTRTIVPTGSSGRVLVCSDQTSSYLAYLLASASSLCSLVTSHSLLGL